MTNDLEQTNVALDVVDPMANVIEPVDSMVGTATATPAVGDSPPEPGNIQGNTRPVFNEDTINASAKINGSTEEMAQTMIRGNTNNNTKQYG